MGTTDDSGVAAQPGQTGGRRRLEVSDVTVVRPEVLRRTLAGTIVGNLMEWYDIGVYGYLAVIIGRMFLPGGSTTAQNLFSLESSPSPSSPGPSAGWCSASSATGWAARRCWPSPCS